MKFPEMDQKSFRASHRHPEVSLEVVEETLLVLQENLFDLLLELDAAVSRWMFSGLDLLQRILFVHLRLGMLMFHFLRGITSFALSLLE